MKLNYYAKLNENNVCIEIISTKRNMKDVRGIISIPDYNDTLLYRKWDGEQWSQERFEPEIPSEIQEKLDKVDSLSRSNETLTNGLKEKDKEIAELKENLNILSDTLDFLLSEGGEV